MAALSIFLLMALNPRWVSADAQNSVMTINMMQSNNWQIGTTLDGMFRSGYPSPFTADSMAAFEAAWHGEEDEQQGTFSMTTDIVSTVDEV